MGFEGMVSVAVGEANSHSNAQHQLRRCFSE